jgi:hypothetical protein
VTAGADRAGEGRDRGQANLVTLAVAMLALTAAVGAGVVVAGDALRGADRTPEQRRVAVALSERLVSDAGFTARPNVLNRSRIDATNASVLRSEFPVVRGSAVRVTLGGRTIASTGDPRGGTTVRRVVLVRRTDRATIAPRIRPGRNVTLPRRTARVRLAIDAPSGATVRTVRANGRVVLHDPGGLRGNFSVAVSRFETTRLRVNANQPLPSGSVRVDYFPARTTKALLEVTVDAA